MSFSISEVENNLIGLTHSGSLSKIRNKYHMMERAAGNLLAKIRPVETMRFAPLASTVHDAQLDYALPSDFGSLIDIYPQVNRQPTDRGSRIHPLEFDRTQTLSNQVFSIEGKAGSKYVRINWNVETPVYLSTVNDVDDNGTWVASGTSTNIVQDKIIKVSGGGSVRFDMGATGDGIQNTTLSAIDVSDSDELADVYLYFYIKDSTELAKLTSVTVEWGNDLTTNYWTGVAQTAQADATSFRVGWNLIKVPWSTATETGTVDPENIDSVKVTFAASSAIQDIRIDNILFSVGHPFDIKYYSKFLFQDSSGTWKSRPTTDTDVVVVDNDAYNIFLYECLDEAAHQMEGEDSAFDMQQAAKKLYGNPQSVDPAARIGLYARYRSMYPSQDLKARGNYGMKPRYNNALRHF